MVTFDLWLPVRLVRCRDVAMLGAAVPEAPVDEDREQTLAENDVRASLAAVGNYELIHPEAQALSMKKGSDLALRTSVSPPICTHVVAASLGACCWARWDLG